MNKETITRSACIGAIGSVIGFLAVIVWVVAMCAMGVDITPQVSWITRLLLIFPGILMLCIIVGGVCSYEAPVINEAAKVEEVLVPKTSTMKRKFEGIIGIVGFGLVMIVIAIAHAPDQAKQAQPAQQSLMVRGEHRDQKLDSADIARIARVLDERVRKQREWEDRHSGDYMTPEQIQYQWQHYPNGY